MGILEKILGSPAPASPQDMNAKQTAALGRRIAMALSSYIKQAGAESLFDPAMLIVLKAGGQVFLSKDSAGDLSFDDEVLSFVAVRNLASLRRCREIIGNGGHAGAVILGVNLLSRAILGEFLLTENQIAR